MLTFELPATTAAAQWPQPNEAAGRSFPLNGEQRLLLAVLEEAIGTFQRYAIASDRRGHALFADVAAWFASEDTQWMFSFVSICDAVGLDVAYVRSGLRRWRDTHRASLETGPLDRLSYDALSPRDLGHKPALPVLGPEDREQWRHGAETGG
jgi:hypothetical protein